MNKQYRDNSSDNNKINNDKSELKFVTELY